MTKATNGANGHQKREYTTPSGVVLQFRPVSSYTLQQINLKYARTKPVPPMIRTFLNNDPALPMEEGNELDANYRHELGVWQAENLAEQQSMMVRLGIVNEPPADFIELYHDLYPDLDKKELKVHWVYSLLGAEDEIVRFFQVLTGQTIITEQGLEQAKETFPSVD